MKWEYRIEISCFATLNKLIDPGEVSQRLLISQLKGQWDILYLQMKGKNTTHEAVFKKYLNCNKTKSPALSTNLKKLWRIEEGIT